MGFVCLFYFCTFLCLFILFKYCTGNTRRHTELYFWHTVLDGCVNCDANRMLFCVFIRSYQKAHRAVFLTTQFWVSVLTAVQTKCCLYVFLGQGGAARLAAWLTFRGLLLQLCTGWLRHANHFAHDARGTIICHFLFSWKMYTWSVFTPANPRPSPLCFKAVSWITGVWVQGTESRLRANCGFKNQIESGFMSLFPVATSKWTSIFSTAGLDIAVDWMTVCTCFRTWRPLALQSLPTESGSRQR